MDFRDICTGVGVRRKIHFRETEGNLGCIGGIVNLSAREGGGSGGNQSICQVGGNEEIPDKQEKGDVWRNGGYKIKRDGTFSP